MGKKITFLKIKELFNLQTACGEEFLDREISGGYAGDLLSDVMSNAQKGDIWITRQGHPNIVAVAVLRMLTGIIIVNNRKPEPETITKALKEKVPILITELPTFELVGRLYELGIKGIHE